MSSIRPSQLPSKDCRPSRASRDRRRSSLKMASSTPKTTKYLEVERKFDVVDSTVAASFEGLSAVARVERSPSQQLENGFQHAQNDEVSRGRAKIRCRRFDRRSFLRRTVGRRARREIAVAAAG